MNLGKYKKTIQVPKPETPIRVPNWPTKKTEEKPIPVQIPEREKVESA